MFAPDYSLRNVYLDEPFGGLFKAIDVVKGFVIEVFDVKESNSKNWKEFNYIPSGFNSSYSNALITDAFCVSFVEEGLGLELNSFLVSVQDGSIFDDVSDEVWALADQIVEKNPKIINYI